jgi:gliding-associated putative ABC transporter substrate-binding component GldG
MQGGKLLFFVDVLYAERDSLQNGNLVAYSRDLNLSDLLFRYGARINTDLLADKHCDKIPIEVGSFGGQSQKQLLPWPYAPLLQAGSSHPLVKNQADVLGQFVNSIDTIDVKGIDKHILLSTSNNTSVKSTPTIIALNNLEVEEDIATYNRSKVPVAILLEGKFSSLYANRVSQAQLDTLKQYGIDFKREAPSTGKVILVADADIVINQVSESIGPLPMGTNKYTRIGYANRDFFLNCTEYLANDRNVLEARAKDYSLRLLDNNKVNNDKFSYQLINILLPILLVLLFTILFQWFRKRKYSL